MLEIYLPIVQVNIDIFLLLFLSLVVGVLSGLFGVGGGFLMTPFLIFMGIPPVYAVPNEVNNILATSLKLNENNFYYDPKNQISQKSIFSTLKKANSIIQKNLGEISSKDTQTFRRGNRNLNCGRHKKIFKERKIISQFCFNCFKIVIEPKNLIELSKLT